LVFEIYANKLYNLGKKIIAPQMTDITDDTKTAAAARSFTFFITSFH